MRLTRPHDVEEDILHRQSSDDAVAKDLPAVPLRPLQALDDRKDSSQLLLLQLGPNPERLVLPLDVGHLERHIVKLPVPVVGLGSELVRANKLPNAWQLLGCLPANVVCNFVGVHHRFDVCPLLVQFVLAPLFNRFVLLSRAQDLVVAFICSSPTRGYSQQLEGVDLVGRIALNVNVCRVVAANIKLRVVIFVLICRRLQTARHSEHHRHALRRHPCQCRPRWKRDC
mmetsp:Transcript_56582/g.101664  ORF Transcript_56582/g.101664 Transcript_56582/m.101664 type:complete len:227 (+) Transcript_56582:846-1526(+)